MHLWCRFFICYYIARHYFICYCIKRYCFICYYIARHCLICYYIARYCLICYYIARHCFISLGPKDGAVFVRSWTADNTHQNKGRVKKKTGKYGENSWTGGGSDQIPLSYVCLPLFLHANIIVRCWKNCFICIFLIWGILGIDINIGFFLVHFFKLDTMSS